MKGLIIRSPWIDHILSGKKTWEMRTRRTSIRGRIALIKARSGLIYGTAELVDCLPKQTHEQLRQTQSFHAIPEAQISSAVENRWTTPWVLRDICLIRSPIPYSHPSGAVTWVDLPDMPTDVIQQGRDEMKPTAIVRNVEDAHQHPTSTQMVQQGKVLDWADIRLTEGNIRNGHFYLRAAERFLPSDCIGGSNKSQAATNIRVQFEPGMLVECDIAGDKMILRSRGEIRDFFVRTGAKADDLLRFCRIGDHDFVVTLDAQLKPQSETRR